MRMPILATLSIAAMLAACGQQETAEDTPADRAVACLAYTALHRGEVLQGGGDAHALDAEVDAWRVEAGQTLSADELEQYYASSVAVFDDEGAEKYASEAATCSGEIRALPAGAHIDDRVGAVAALQAALEPDLEQQVRVDVTSIAIDGDWAFIQAQPVELRGADIDWSRTKYAEQAAEGVLDGDGTTYALVQRENGAWVTREFAIGPTDVIYLDWPQRYGAPASLIETPAAPAAQ